MLVFIHYMQGNILWLPVALRLQIHIYSQGLATQQLLFGHLNLPINPELAAFNPCLQSGPGVFGEQF